MECAAWSSGWHYELNEGRRAASGPQHYNYFRDYDPSTGRYVQSDPIGLAGGINSFAYVYSSPMVYTDSSGLAAEAIFFGYENSYVGAVKYVSPVGSFTIGAHGYINLDTFLGTRAIKGPDGKPLTGAEVWELIKEDFESGEYETIRVAACWAGWS